MILFETTESVIEILWDIALAFFLVRLAFVYFLLNLVSALALSYYYYYPLASQSAGEQLPLLPLLLLVANSAVWARFVIVYYEVPRVTGFRIAAGVTSLVFMVLAEMVAGLVMYEEGYYTGRQQWMMADYLKGGAEFGAVMAAYALMPWVQMGLEGLGARGEEEDESTSHGHEGKTLVDAVPTVNLSEKSLKQKKME
ncbi:hypothetical protein B0H66DRAFT_597164 [Apodospora peruviana]|uniref:Uncharacterized protein n=1 Tax=Apodospora peruviana TaxID=516989 RepID=A0AAE0IQY4_9PEZI|nr:hypothetical protein B0H66DRAFT_597164 [Apodospora peruviana]